MVSTVAQSLPMVSSNVIALIFNEARIASLSANVGSSLLGTANEKFDGMLNFNGNL